MNYRIIKRTTDIGTESFIIQRKISVFGIFHFWMRETWLSKESDTLEEAEKDVIKIKDFYKKIIKKEIVKKL